MSVIITGAGGGLGTAVAKAFVATGAKVIGVERHWRDPMAFVTIQADLTTADGCETMVAQALEHGPIEALVHLVGGFGGGAAISETSDATWDLMMNVNLRAAFLTLRAVLKPMTRAKRGSIVAIGSRAAVEPMPNFAAYAVAKAGLVALIKNVAAETKDSGITANAVLPSVIDTPANRKAMPQSDFSRWVAPESIAKLLVWLASEESSDVSGAVIPIYGRA
ncbi:MAG TPA: SDR family NAD(P)-dependent oxidoreductase [Bryobacteraceae bacterium]|nr:SDR family NAD(P)-dependent oxidoreductase [Bryobacteraceae bacterium]